MTLPDDQLRGRLPPLYSQEAEPEPMVYAQFHLPGTTRAWSVIEGQPEDKDFLFFGFLAGPNVFGHFRLYELERIRGLFDSRVERDQTFTEGRLTDVAPAPDS